MREINEYKKRKVIKLFLAGVSYDEIAQELGIAKGTVVNVVNDFREGRLKLPPESAEYVDALRKAVVDLRKSNTNVNQLVCYLKIHNKIQELGVETEDIEDWLEVSKALASSISGNRFKEVALEMYRIKRDKGIGYTELVEDYQGKIETLKAIKDEIAKEEAVLEKLEKDKEQSSLEMNNMQKQLTCEKQNYDKQKLKLRRDIDKYLEDNRLTWERIRAIEAVSDSAFRSAGLNHSEVLELRNRILAAGSLLKLLEQLKETKRLLEEQAEFMVIHHEHNYDELAQLVREREQAELAVKNRRSEIKKLDDEIESKKTEINRLAKVIHDNRERIYAADVIMTFLFAPNGVSRAQLDNLVSMFISLRKIKLGIGPKIVTDTEKKIVCRCEVPAELSGEDLQGLDSNKVREALAYAIAPIVDDKYVPRIIHDITLRGHPIIGDFGETKEMAEKIIPKPGN
jgi:transposase-like protein